MKRRIVAFIAGGLSLALLVGSWAFYTSTSVVDNQLETNAYGDTLHEKFTPDKDWEPGEVVTKEVGVRNTGDYDLVVRVKLNEEWWRDGDVDGVLDAGESMITLASTDNSGADRLKMNYDTLTGAKQEDFAGANSGPTDGIIKDATKSDETVVFKQMDHINGNSDGWTLHTDGWWYYNGKLSSGQTTKNLISSIMLAKDADMGKYDVAKYYTVDSSLIGTEPNTANIGSDPTTKWVIYSGAVPSVQGFDDVYTRTVSKLSADAGYAGAVYDLYITSQTCQASSDAVTATFPTAPPAIVTGWGL